MLKALQSKLLFHKVVFKNLQNKLLTLIVLSTGVPVSIVGLYGITSSTNALFNLSLNQIDYEVANKSNQIDNFLKGTSNDIVFLSNISSIQGIIKAKENNSVNLKDGNRNRTIYEDWIRRAKTTFNALIVAKPQYKTLQFLDENGKELVRVDNAENQKKNSSETNVMASETEALLKKTVLLPKGAVYVYPVALKTQLGESAEAVVHYSTPVYYKAQKQRGTIILTLSLEPALKSLQQATNVLEGDILLTSKDGTYLFDFDLSKGSRMAVDSTQTVRKNYPTEVINQILSHEFGNIHDVNGNIISHRMIRFDDKNQMILIREVPRTIILQPLNTFKSISLGIIVISLGTALAIGISIIRKIAKNQAFLFSQAKNAAATAEAKAQELEQTLQELHQTQMQLVQTEKMSSLGQLVAGIAHEINNPVNFIYGNLSHVNDYTHDILHLIQCYQAHYPNPDRAIQEEAEAIDLDFLMQDMPKMLDSMRMGADRIRQIVLSLRNFSRTDEADFKSVDIHDGIDSTLLILQNRLKPNGSYPGIEIIKDYSQLPAIECFPGQLNQVFMNLLSNAIDVLDETVSLKSTPTNQLEPATALACSLPTIHIHTELCDRHVIIRIRDNGLGIPENVRDRLFEPFFTTKPIGKGTGLGLSISYQIITEKHGGELKCFSAVGVGTEFWIKIPVRQGNEA
jgi:signal transduction histidine kinase